MRPLLSTASTEKPRDSPVPLPVTSSVHSRGQTQAVPTSSTRPALHFAGLSSICTKREFNADVCRLRRFTSTSGTSRTSGTAGPRLTHRARRQTPRLRRAGAQAGAGPRRSACVWDPKRHSRHALHPPCHSCVRETTAVKTTRSLRVEAATSWCPWLALFRLGILGQAGSWEVTAMGGPAGSA